MDLVYYINFLWSYMRGINSKRPRYLIDKGRQWFADNGLECNPLGVGNSKTALVTTYRPVHKSCNVKRCPFAPKECYGLGFPVCMSSNRASVGTDSSVNAFVLALIVSALTSKLWTREGGTGGIADPHCRSEVNYDLLYWFGRALEECKRLSIIDDSPKAYLYTVFDKIKLGVIHSQLTVNYSHQLCQNGVVVWYHDRIEELRQLTSRPLELCNGRCADCGLCAQPDRESVIVLKPHGNHAESAFRKSQALIYSRYGRGRYDYTRINTGSDDRCGSFA